MSTPWAVAKTENRRELVLHGTAISKLIEETNELPNLIWSLKQLNFLEVSNVGISNVSREISHLENLRRLCLKGNKLSQLPLDMSELKKLTTVDASVNVLTSLDPLLFDSWINLTTLNLSGNQLTSIPPLGKLENLQYINVANNKLETLPEDIGLAAQLLQIDAQCNALIHLPDNVSELSHLRLMNIYSNQLRDVPVDLWKCSKLKELHAHGNKFTDNRLRKMTEDGKTSCSAILEYTRKRSGLKGKVGKGKGKGRTRGASRGDTVEEEPVSENRKVIDIVRPVEDEDISVQITESAIAQRPYLVCCVVRGVDFSSEQLCRSFIKYQEGLHETTCERRLKAAIGAHDMSVVSAPLVYTTADASEVKIIPLGSTKQDSAHVCISRLRQKAEAERKRLKRKTVTGANKYLWLLKDATHLLHMHGADGLVLSIHPITNCNGSRLTPGTQNIFLEVSGTDRLDLCKSIMDSLIIWLTEHCSGAASVLKVEQTRVICADTGELRVLYPSANDLRTLPEGIVVSRP